MTTITQVIAPFPVAPDYALRPTQFDVEANAFVNRIDDMDEELNAFAAQANTVAGEVNANAQTAINKAGDATAQAAFALTRANDAAAAAASATGAAGVSGTSTNNVTLALGQRNFSYVETGKLPFVGMRMRAVSRSAPGTNFGLGYVYAYDAASRLLTLFIDQLSEFPIAAADWNLVLEGQPGLQGPQPEMLMPFRDINADGVLVNDDNGKHIDCQSQVTLTAPTSLYPGWAAIINARAFPVNINAQFDDGYNQRTLRPRTSGMLSFNGVTFRFGRMGAQLPSAQLVENSQTVLAPFGVIGVKATITGGGSAGSYYGHAGGTAIKTFPVSAGQSVVCTVNPKQMISSQGLQSNGGSASLVTGGLSAIAYGASIDNAGTAVGGDINLAGGRGGPEDGLGNIGVGGASFWGGGYSGVGGAYGAGYHRVAGTNLFSGQPGVIFLEWIMG